MTKLLTGLLLALAALGARAGEITVSAAASLTNAFKELARVYETGHPGTHVQLNFGASGALLQQIVKGAPVDVFASADQETMNNAVQQKLVRAAERRDFARNRLVVVVPADAKAPPPSLAALAQPQVKRIAMGLPASVPAGRYARRALNDAGLWQAVAPKIIGTQNVRQALDYVARGEVDAGFVYATDAALMPQDVRTAFEVPLHEPVTYPIAPLAASASTEARAFVAYVLSAPAQAILARYGFAQP
ncbi:molybdate ABC transporter substrate-binding protein [Massilia arenosa]|uniref:Molybdate ABC transporter substrate-binding protein n=1 Tax=Zemynaea arenosa TaxID=2561931 RepID=A0A4Y9RPE4_9BURK|nr:molybdate ABC transporter substrate-binding protein [Massilia arenosa]TFW10763.1 molybdate ABC transporter substrate-binding protein [Massilia arenosa]